MTDRHLRYIKKKQYEMDIKKLSTATLQDIIRMAEHIRQMGNKNNQGQPILNDQFVKQVEAELRRRKITNFLKWSEDEKNDDE